MTLDMNYEGSFSVLPIGDRMFLSLNFSSTLIESLSSPKLTISINNGLLTLYPSEHGYSVTHRKRRARLRTPCNLSKRFQSKIKLEVENNKILSKLPDDVPIQKFHSDARRRGEPTNKKITNITPIVKTRKCLKCRKTFHYTHRGNFICAPCNVANANIGSLAVGYFD